MDIVVSGLGGEIVSAFDVDVYYDMSLLPVDATFGTDLDGGFFASFQFWWDDWAGTLDIAELSLLPDADLAAMQGDSVILATMTFSTTWYDVGLGLAGLELVLDLASGNDVKGLNNQVILPTTVPEPASVLLMGLGLVGLWGRAVVAHLLQRLKVRYCWEGWLYAIPFIRPAPWFDQPHDRYLPDQWLTQGGMEYIPPFNTQSSLYAYEVNVSSSPLPA